MSNEQFRPHPLQIQIGRYAYTKGTAVPVTSCEGPQDCEMSRLPHFLDNRLTDVGEIRLAFRPPSTLHEDSWYTFRFEAESIPGP
jgi:hypothetical protein